MYGSNESNAGAVGDGRVKVVQATSVDGNDDHHHADDRSSSIPISQSEAVDFLTRFLYAEQAKQDQAYDYSTSTVFSVAAGSMSQSLWEDLYSVAYSMAQTTDGDNPSRSQEQTARLRNLQNLQQQPKANPNSPKTKIIEDDGFITNTVPTAATTTSTTNTAVFQSNNGDTKEVSSASAKLSKEERKREKEAKRAAKKAKKEAKRARKEEKANAKKKQKTSHE